MSKRDHNVSIVFDDMGTKQALLYNEKWDTIERFEDSLVKQIASVVRGLASKWKQPLGYFLCPGPIKSTILESLAKECIGKLEKTGLTVVAIFCDQGSNNSFLHQIENLTLKKPYIRYGDKKIHVLYDSPHLLKNI